MAVNVGRAFVTVLPDLKGFGASLAAGIKAQGTAATSAAAGVGAMAGGALVAGIAGTGYLAKVGADWHQAMKTIRVETGATGPALDGLKESLKNVLGSTAATKNDAAAAIATLNTRLGLTGKPLEELSIQMVRLSGVTGTDLTGNLNAASDALYNWNVPAEQFGSTNDMLFRVTQATGISFADLSGALASGGAQFRAAGFDMQGAASVIGLLSKAGLSASDAMPALQKAMATAAKEGKSSSQVFQDTFAAIKNAPDDTAAASAAVETFGGRAGPKFAALIREGKLSWEEFSASIAKGDTIEQAAIDTRTWQGAIQNFKNIIDNELEPAGTKVFNNLGNIIRSVKPAIQGVATAFGFMADILAKVPGPLWGVLAVVAVGVVSFATIAKVVGTTIGVVKNLFVVLKGAVAVVKGVALAFKAIGMAMMANPIILIIVAIIAVVILLWYHWDTVTKWVAAAWEWLGGALAAVWNFIAGIFSAIGGILYDWIIAPFLWVVNLWVTWWQLMWSVVVGIWNAIVFVVVGAWNLITGAIGAAVNWITTTVQAAWDGILSIITTVGEFIKTAAAGAFDWILDKLRAIRDFAAKIGEAFTNGFSTVVGWLNTAKDTAIGFVQAMWDKIKEFIGWVKDNAEKIAGPVGTVVEKTAGAVSGAWNAATDFLGFAKGGRVRPSMGPVWVGEQGPELVTFDRAGHVTPSAESMQAVAGGNGGGGVQVAGPLLAITGEVTIRSDQDIVELSRQLARDVNTRARAAGDARPLTGATA